MNNLQKLIKIYNDWNENSTYDEFVENLDKLQYLMIDYSFEKAVENNWDAEQWLCHVLEKLEYTMGL